MENKNITEIGELVIDEKYAEAFGRLPRDIRKIALSTRRRMTENIGDIFKTDPDAYKTQILDALSTDISQAAKLLAAHPANAPVKTVRSVTTDAPANIAAKTATKAEVARLAPPFYKRSEFRSFPPFSMEEEALAELVYSETDPKLEAWLIAFEHDHQVPSVFGIRHFVDEKIRGLKNAAEKKLRSNPPEALTTYESNTLYHEDEYRATLIQEAEYLRSHKGFGNLIECAFVELFDAVIKLPPYNANFKNVYKSSDEEDLFRKSDVVFEMNNGRYVSVDITTGTDKTAEEKTEKMGRSRFKSLPNLEAMLKKQELLAPNERIQAIPIVGQIDKKLMRNYTVNRMRAIQEGDARAPVEIFRETARSLGKNSTEELKSLAQAVNL